MVPSHSVTITPSSLRVNEVQSRIKKRNGRSLELPVRGGEEEAIYKRCLRRVHGYLEAN